MQLLIVKRRERQRPLAGNAVWSAAVFDADVIKIADAVGLTACFLRDGVKCGAQRFAGLGRFFNFVP